MLGLFLPKIPGYLYLYLFLTQKIVKLLSLHTNEASQGLIIALLKC